MASNFRFAAEMGHLDDKNWDFKHGVVSLDSQMVTIHYHLECQDITHNGSDNKLWLMQSNQMVLFANKMGNLDDKKLDFSSMVCCN